MYYFIEGDFSYLIDGFNCFIYYCYYMGLLYKGVIIIIFIIILLVVSFCIVVIIWFGF